jgi:hypothetical protein
MRSEQDAVYTALVGGRGFLRENRDVLTSAVDLTVAERRLDVVIEKLSAHAVDQDVNRRSSKGETEKQLQLRLALRTEHLHLIAEIARHSLRDVPEFKALQMPATSTKGQRFLASAQGMAHAAEVHKAALLDRGLPADCLELFQAGLGELAASLSERDQNRTRRLRATKGLAVEEREGRSVLKVLDALVRRALKGNDALLRSWEGARKVRRLAGSTTAQPTESVTPLTTPTPGAVSGPSSTAAAA